MPLSEHESQILKEIERELHREDPDFVLNVQRTVEDQVFKRVRLGVLTFLAGLVLLAAFFLTTLVAAGAAGFILMVAGAALSFQNLLRLARQSDVQGSLRNTARQFAARLRGRRGAS